MYVFPTNRWHVIASTIPFVAVMDEPTVTTVFGELRGQPLIVKGRAKTGVLQ